MPRRAAASGGGMNASGMSGPGSAQGASGEPSGSGAGDHKTDAKRAITSAEGLLTQVEEAGITSREVSNILDNARSSFSRGDFEHARVLATESEKLARETFDKNLKHIALDAIDKSTDLVGRAKRAGGDIRKAEQMLTEAGEAFHRKDFNRARQLAQNILETLDDPATADRPKEFYDVRNMIRETEAILSDMSRNGQNTVRAEQELKNSREALERENNISKADLLLQSSLRMIDNMKDSRDAIMDDLRGLQERAQQLAEAGMDISAVNNTLQDAVGALNNGSERRAKGYVSRIKSMLDDMAARNPAIGGSSNNNNVGV